jgi:alpha-tubulin suppressor-like RCC1 family protein
MTWSFLDNCYLGDCKERDTRHKWRKVSMGQRLYAGIDEFGKLYTWGGFSSSDGHHEIEEVGAPVETYPVDRDNASPTSLQLAYTKQLGQSHDWVDVQTSEQKLMAMNERGQIYIVGRVFYREGGIGIVGSPETGQFEWNGSTQKWEKDGLSGANDVIDLTLVENSLGIDSWDAFAAGWYHVLGLKDGKVYVWGTNFGVAFGSTSPVAEDDNTDDAVEMTWLPGTSLAKMVRADLYVSVVVTEDDKIYAWGDWSFGTPTTAPVEITGITIPAGETIVDVQVSNVGGMVALLSDGSVWGMGFFNMTASSPPWIQTFTELTAFPQSVKVDCNSFSLAAIDIDGNIYAIGNIDWFLSRSDASCNVNSWDAIYLVQATNPGDRIWLEVSCGKFQTHAAIDYAGYLWTWGVNNSGGLAYGLSQGTPDSFASS